MKLCKRCGIEKERVDFYPADESKPARGACRRCVIQAATQSNVTNPNRSEILRRYNNSSKGQKTQERFDEQHPGERHKYIIKHYNVFPERLIAKRDRDRRIQAERYHADPEAAKAAATASLRRHPETKRAIDHRRRAQKWKAIGFHTKADLEAIWLDQAGRCAVCSADCWRTTSPDGSHVRKWTIDHIYPISRGGSEWPWNLRGLCLSCNAAKKDKVNSV